MLKITVPASEQYDSVNNVFIPVKEQTLTLEHSLVSLSKWEANWCKPFLGKDKRTAEEMMDYIKCMTVTPNVNPSVYLALSQKNINDITEYINAPMTATTFNTANDKPSREIVTSELIYFWMVTFGIPFDPCQKWHLNRLLTLVKVCSVKNAPSKKMGKNELNARNRSLNAARRARLHSKG